MLSRDHSALGNAFLWALPVTVAEIPGRQVLLCCHRVTQDGRDLWGRSLVGSGFR